MYFFYRLFIITFIITSYYFSYAIDLSLGDLKTSSSIILNSSPPTHSASPIDRKDIRNFFSEKSNNLNANDIPNSETNGINLQLTDPRFKILSKQVINCEVYGEYQPVREEGNRKVSNVFIIQPDELFNVRQNMVSADGILYFLLGNDELEFSEDRSTPSLINKWRCKTVLNKIDSDGKIINFGTFDMNSLNMINGFYYVEISMSLDPLKNILSILFYFRKINYELINTDSVISNWVWGDETITIFHVSGPFYRDPPVRFFLRTPME